MIQILPSILTADFTEVNNDIDIFKKLGVEEIHLDVMDGNFVPTITFGPKYITDIRSHQSDIKLDCHLMINNPQNSIKQFIDTKVDSITCHIESCKEKDLKEIEKQVKEAGIKFGLSLNPNTDIKKLEKILKKIKPDIILIMSVVPGAGGQQFMPEVLNKAKRLIELKTTNAYNYELEIDGGITLNNLKEVIDNKIERIVVGSSIYKNGTLEENVIEFNSKIKFIAGN